MGNIKQINIKNRTYYIFNDMINIKNFDSSLTKIVEKSYKNIGIYYIGYITIKSISDYENINSVNPLSFIIGEIDGYIEENNGNKYLTFASTDKNKIVLEKYIKLWDEIKYHIQTINTGNSLDDIQLNKILKLHMLTIIVRSIFEEDGKYYPQAFLDDCLYEV